MTTCGVSAVRKLLIVFNLTLMLSGICLLGLGIWILVDESVVNTFNIFRVIQDGEHLLSYAAYILIVVGIFIVFVVVVGHFGILRESKVLLGLYIALLVMVLVLEIAAGALALVYKDRIEVNLGERFTREFRQRYGGTSESDKDFAKGLHEFQVEFECCGINGATDYYSLVPSVDIPYSCCLLTASGRGKKASDLTSVDVRNVAGCSAGRSEAIYNKGCKGLLDLWIKKHSTALIGVGIGIACVELFGIIFAVCLCSMVMYG